jgi:hypothetical protein
MISVKCIIHRRKDILFLPIPAYENDNKYFNLAPGCESVRKHPPEGILKRETCAAAAVFFRDMRDI